MNPQVPVKTARKAHEVHGSVYCPICTHTVEATILSNGKIAQTKPGQKCARCSASLDAGYIFRVDRAA